MNVKSKSKSSREAGDFKWLTLEEISTFLNHVATRVDKSDDPDNKYDPVKYIALFNLAYQHGLRRQEIVNLTVGDYDRERKTIRVVRVKGGLKRIYPLSKEAVIQLNNWLKHRESEMNIKNTPDSPLFCNTRGEKSNPYSASRMFSTIAVEVGFAGKGYSIHSLRHSIIMHLCNAKWPVERIQDWAGHASISSTMEYIRLADSTRVETAEEISKFAPKIKDPRRGKKKKQEE